MKKITEKELLKLNDIEKIQTLRKITEGEIKYIGGNKQWKKEDTKKYY